MKKLNLSFSPYGGLIAIPSDELRASGAREFQIDPEDLETADRFHCASSSHGWPESVVDAWDALVGAALMAIDMRGDYSIDDVIQLSLIKVDLLDWNCRRIDEPLRRVQGLLR